MADFKYFTDKEKSYTKIELEQAKLLDDQLLFGEDTETPGNFKFLGYLGDFMGSGSSSGGELLDFQAIELGKVSGMEHKTISGRIEDATFNSWSLVEDSGEGAWYYKFAVSGALDNPHLVSDGGSTDAGLRIFVEGVGTSYEKLSEVVTLDVSGNGNITNTYMLISSIRIIDNPTAGDTDIYGNIAIKYGEDQTLLLIKSVESRYVT